MVVAGFDRYDLHNAPLADGATFTVWFAGCTHGCVGCQNEILWSRDNGIEYTPQYLFATVVNETLATNIKNVVLLGGEPLQQDLDELSELCELLNNAGYNIWLYTGYDFDVAMSMASNVLENIDYMKCGKYIQELHVEGAFPVTSNQILWQHSSQFGDDMWVRVK